MLRLREVWLAALLSVVGCSGSGTEDADGAPGGAAGTGAGGTSAGKGGIGGGAGAAGFTGGSAGASAGSGGLGGGAGGSVAGGAGTAGGSGKAGSSGNGGKGGASGSVCGAPCTGTGCAPQPMFTDPFHRFTQLSGDAGSLVWVDEGSTGSAGAPSVLTMPKGGGKPETVAGPFMKSARSPVLTSGGVYFLGDGVLLRRAPGASTAAPFPTENADKVEALTADDKHVFWSTFYTLYRANPDGSGRVVLADKLTVVEGQMELGPGHVYWRAGGDLQRAPRDGGPVETLASKPGLTTSFSVSDGTVYLGDFQAMTLAALGGASGTPATLVSGVVVGEVAAAGPCVFWTNYTKVGSDTSLEVVPAAGGPSVVLGLGLYLGLSPIVVDDASLYVIVGDSTIARVKR